MPVKIINRVFENLFFNKINDLKKDIDLLNGIEQPLSTLNFQLRLEARIMKLISYIVDLNSYVEIREIKQTLKILTLIRANSEGNFAPPSLSFSIKNYVNPRLEHIMDAVVFLLLEFKMNNYEIRSLDTNICVEFLYNTFNYILKDEKDVEEYYIHINTLLENLMFKQSFNPSKKSKLRKSVYPSTNKNADSYEIDDEKQIFQTLQEEIQYKYLSFQANEIESKRQAIISPITEKEDYNSEEEEDLLNKSYNSDDQEEFNNMITRKNKNVDLNLSIRKEDMDLAMNELNEKTNRLINHYYNYIKLKLEHSNKVVQEVKRAICLIVMANLLKNIKREEESMKKCVQAIEIIKKATQDIGYKGNLAMLNYYIFSSVLFERVLFILSEINCSFDQVKSQYFIFIKIMDMSAIYNKSLRKDILQKMMDYLKVRHYNLIVKKKSNLKEIRGLINDQDFLDSKLLIHKIRTLFNVTNASSKNVVMCFDVDFPFLSQNKTKFKQFLYETISKEEFSRNCIFFSLFNFRNLFVHLNSREINDPLVINVKKAADINDDNDLKDGGTIPLDLDSNNFAEYYDNFNFIFLPKEKLPTKGRRKFTNDHELQSNVNLAIDQVLNVFEFNDFPKNNNFIFIFTTTRSSFDFSTKNLISTSTHLLDKQFSVILCLFVHDLEADKKIINKYNEWINNHILNGKMYIVRQFYQIKNALYSILPQPIRMFNFKKFKNFCKSIE